MKRTEASKSDEYGTPPELLPVIFKIAGFTPTLDPFATEANAIFPHFITKEQDALKHPWLEDAYVNGPFSCTKECVEKCHKEWKENNINIVMLISARSMKMNYWHDIIEANHIEYHPLRGGICFLVDGKPYRDSKGRKSYHQQAFLVVIWRRRKSIDDILDEIV